MANNNQKSNSVQTNTALTISKEEFKTIIDQRILLGNEIFAKSIFNLTALEDNRQEFLAWDDYNSEYLKHAFNNENNEYRRSYDNTGAMSFFVNNSQQKFNEKVRRIKQKISNKIDYLIKLSAKTELLKCAIIENDNHSETESMILDKTQVFIVHGHDDNAKIKTARFVEKLGLKPIILHEQASGSKTIIEKIEAYSNVGFGIVLYTPCDLGSINNEEAQLKHRARQNVVFEHGFLIGKIGRENVCALVKGDIETPNDISGVVYVSMDDNDAWQYKIAKELRLSGYDVDLNKL